MNFSRSSRGDLTISAGDPVHEEMQGRTGSQPAGAKEKCQWAAEEEEYIFTDILISASTHSLCAVVSCL